MRLGKLINVEKAVVSTGGPVSNTGINMKRLGSNVCFCVCVGDDQFGKLTIDMFKQNGNADGIHVLEGVFQMKRSFINRKIKEAIEYCNSHDFHLPKWAYWTPQQWANAGHEADEIRRCKLGWDVTYFGSNDYQNMGLLAFTIRNGNIAEVGKDPAAKNYCEKLLLVDESQVTPTHFHWSKMEDIINRAGGKLVIQLWNANRETEAINEVNNVVVSIDGIERTIPAGGTVVLEPGESITLPPYMYHNFYAKKGDGMVLGGEVSRVNDDENDNRFNPPLPRFSEIEEDEASIYLLCGEYPEADLR